MNRFGLGVRDRKVNRLFQKGMISIKVGMCVYSRLQEHKGSAYMSS